MQVTVRCFSTVRERVGTDRLPVQLAPGATLADVVYAVATRTPQAAELVGWLASGHLRLAHNRVHAPPERLLSDGDEVALFPPVSGG